MSTLKRMDAALLYIELADARERQAGFADLARRSPAIRRQIARLASWLWGAYARKVTAEIETRGFGATFLAATSRHWGEP